MASCDDLVDEVLMHCAFAIGRGARMNVKREGLVKWRKVVVKDTTNFICREKSPVPGDTSKPGEERWDVVKNRTLAICEAVGRVAADSATKKGSPVIELKDLRYAYNKVRETCLSDRVRMLGPLCPDSEWS